MQFIKQLIFGIKTKPVDTISIGFNTVVPENQPSYEDWCNEFRIGMLYDRKIIYLN
jgi:hypothetical protein